MTEDIRNGRDLFHATEDQFDYWYADAYGIHAGLTVSAYQDLSADEAREIHDELEEVIEFCEQLEMKFPDIHD